MTSEIAVEFASAGAISDERVPRRPRRGSEVVGYLLRRPGLVLAAVYVLLVLVASAVPTLFTAESPLVGDVAQRLTPPSAEHVFGTDHLGRDLFSRVIHGTGLSIQATAVAVAVAFVVGGLLGLVSGWAGGRVDSVVMRIVDVLLAVPSLLMAMALIAALGNGTLNVAIAVGIAGIANFARVMRSEVLKVRTAPFVEASRSSGARWHQVLAWHVLPNARGPVIALGTLEFGMAILSVSALSFLGYGAQPPTPEWGSLIAEGRDYLATAWWLTTLPGLVVVLTVLSVNRVSRGIEDWSTR